MPASTTPSASPTPAGRHLHVDAYDCGANGILTNYAFDGIDAGSFDCTWADNYDGQDVSVDVSDDDGGTDSDAISVDIANVKPSVSLSGDDSAFEGQTKTYTFSITDPGQQTPTPSPPCAAWPAPSRTTPTTR